MTDSACNRLINDYVESYMGPFFYYCLKRTGDSQAAADLSQDIAQQILSALKGGIVPEHFPAWSGKSSATVTVGGRLRSTDTPNLSSDLTSGT